MDVYIKTDTDELHEEVTADSRGRVTLGSEYANETLNLAVVERNPKMKTYVIRGMYNGGVVEKMVEARTPQDAREDFTAKRPEVEIRNVTHFTGESPHGHPPNR
jgi:hypothetical protein